MPENSRHEIHVPPELPPLLEEFTVSVLRNQPSDLLAYAAEYFVRVRDERLNDHSTRGVGFHDEIVAGDSQEKWHEEVENYGNRRKSVAAEKYDPTQDDQDTIDSMCEDKTDEQSTMLLGRLNEGFLFDSIDLRMRKKVVRALKERRVRSGEYIIRQGESGDFYYIIEQGEFAIFVKENANEGGDGKQIEVLKDHGSFGELALMYDQPRSATIRALTEGTLWALDRATFRRIIVFGAYQRRVMVNKTLMQIPMLAPLTEDDRNNLVDALVMRSFEDGDQIIHQGDVNADSMFIIEEGEVSIVVQQLGGHPREITRLHAKDYFGERALVTLEPRQASAFAVGEVTVMELRVDAFERFLGPCIEVMKRNMAFYEEQVSAIFGGSDEDSMSSARRSS